MLETYIAGRFRGTISDPAVWSGLYARTVIPEPLRKTAERIVADRPPPSEEEMADAAVAAARVLEEMQPLSFSYHPLASGFLAMIYVWLVAFLSLACALVFRGGLALLLLGVAVVKEDGARASRLRVFWRSIIAWLPVPALFLALGPLADMLSRSDREEARLGLAAYLTFAVYLPLALWSALRPARGLQDVVARTWLVPR
jgi:hypothetical protein